MRRIRKVEILMKHAISTENQLSYSTEIVLLLLFVLFFSGRINDLPEV